MEAPMEAPELRRSPSGVHFPRRVARLGVWLVVVGLLTSMLMEVRGGDEASSPSRSSGHRASGKRKRGHRSTSPLAATSSSEGGSSLDASSDEAKGSKMASTSGRRASGRSSTGSLHEAGDRQIVVLSPYNRSPEGTTPFRANSLESPTTGEQFVFTPCRLEKDEELTPECEEAWRRLAPRDSPNIFLIIQVPEANIDNVLAALKNKLFLRWPDAFFVNCQSPYGLEKPGTQDCLGGVDAMVDPPKLRRPDSPYFVTTLGALEVTVNGTLKQRCSESLASLIELQPGTMYRGGNGRLRNMSQRVSKRLSRLTVSQMAASYKKKMQDQPHQRLALLRTQKGLFLLAPGKRKESEFQKDTELLLENVVHVNLSRESIIFERQKDSSIELNCAGKVGKFSLEDEVEFSMVYATQAWLFNLTHQEVKQWNIVVQLLPPNPTVAFRHSDYNTDFVKVLNIRDEKPFLERGVHDLLELFSAEKLKERPDNCFIYVIGSKTESLQFFVAGLAEQAELSSFFMLEQVHILKVLDEPNKESTHYLNAFNRVQLQTCSVAVWDSYRPISAAYLSIGSSSPCYYAVVMKFNTNYYNFHVPPEAGSLPSDMSLPLDRLVSIKWTLDKVHVEALRDSQGATSIPEKWTFDIPSIDSFSLMPRQDVSRPHFGPPQFWPLKIYCGERQLDVEEKGVKLYVEDFSMMLNY